MYKINRHNIGGQNKNNSLYGCLGGYCCGIFLVNLLLGWWSFAYCLNELFHKSIPWYGNMICGLFLGEITFPLAIVLWFLSLFGVHLR